MLVGSLQIHVTTLYLNESLPLKERILAITDRLKHT